MTKKTIYGSYVASSFDSSMEFAATGHREIAPIYMKEKDTGLLAVQGSHGIYRAAIHPDGRPVIIFAADPADMVPTQHTDPKFKEKYAPGYYLNMDEVDNMDVVAARRKRTHKKWAAQAISEHSYYLNEVKSEFGILYRVAENMWMSGAIAYKLEPAYKNKKRILGEDGTPLFVLRCYTTAGKDTAFTPVDELAIRQNKGMNFSSKSALVKHENAEQIIHDDFVKRVELVMRDKDPNKLGYIKGEPEMTSELTPGKKGMKAATFHNLRHYAVRLTQIIYQQVRSLRTQVVVMGGLKTAFLSAIQLVFKGPRAFVGQLLFGAVQPLLAALKRVQNMNSRSEDIGYSFWKPGRSAITGNRHYCKLDPKQGSRLRLFTYEESDILPSRGATLKAGLPADWAEDYILGTLSTPTGSMAECREINGAEVLYMLEPGGLEMYYIGGRKKAFAIYRPDLAHEKAEALPEPVKKLMEEKGPIVKVWEDDEGNLHSGTIDAEKLEEELKTEAGKTKDIELVPELTHDLSALNEFNKRAERDWQPPKTFAGKTIKMGYNAAAKAKCYVTKEPFENKEQGFVADVLDSKLSGREVVKPSEEEKEVKAQERPASNKDPVPAPSPTAQP